MGQFSGGDVAVVSTVATPAGSAIIGKVGIDQTTAGTTNAVSVAQLGATTVSTGNGVSGAGVQRVTLASDSTGQVALAAQATGGYSFSNIATAATTTVKSGAGTLHSIIITNPGATSNSIKIYDNTLGSGTVILDFSTAGGLPVVGTYILDVAFATGCTVVTAGTTSPNLTVIYK